jgi:hypothetical protein
MISVQNNGTNPVNPPKQDNKTNLPLVIGSSLLGGAFAAAVAHETHSYKEEGDVISTNLDRYTKLDNGLKVEYAFSDDKKDPPTQVDTIKNGKLTKREINYAESKDGFIKTSLDFDEEGHVTKGVKSLGDTSIEYTQVISPNKGNKIASTEIKIENQYIPSAGYGYSETSPHNQVWRPWVWDTDILPEFSEEHKHKIAKLAPVKGNVSVKGYHKKAPIRYLGGDIPTQPQVLSEKLPKTFEEVIPYLKAKRNMHTALWGIGVGLLAGGSALLISRLTAKKTEAILPQTTS